MKYNDKNKKSLSGDELILILNALSNPNRIRIISKLADGRKYVSQLAREVKMSRPLLYMHLKILKSAGLVKSDLELSLEGKAMNYYQLIHFDFHITDKFISEAADTVSIKEERSE